MRKVCPLFILFFFHTFLFAQQGNIWYFGESAGLDFNTLPPKPLISSDFKTMEGAASVSDYNGNLLFYTDGTTVYTRTHKVMANGTGLLGNSSTTQSSLIIPWPGKPDLFYLFTADALENMGNNGYNYSVIDISRHGGEGEVIEKNVLLYKPSTEKLAVALHCNGKDWWVITKQKYNNTFYNYLINENGIQATPVVCNVGKGLSTDELQMLGGLVVSPDGKKLAMMVRSEDNDFRSQVFDFDNVSGLITNSVAIEGSNYMAAFSPNSRYLYVTDDSTIKQYDLANSIDSVSLASTLITVNPGNSYGAGIKLGPDGKIYVSTLRMYLDVIHKPNEKGNACLYEKAAVKLLSTSSMGLPHTIPRSLASPLNLMISYSGVGDPCSRTLELAAIIENEVQNVVYEWTFADGRTSRDEKVVYTFPANTNSSKKPDTFVVKLKVTADEKMCSGVLRKSTEVQKLVILDPPPKADAGLDTTIVIRQPLLLQGAGGATYDWSPPEFLRNPTSANPMAIIEKDQIFTLTVTSENGCKAQDQVFVKVIPTSDIFVPNAFTPNNDGKNDVLKVFPVGARLLHFEVYNRWGQKVYTTTRPDVAWDGYLNSHALPTGIYSWLLLGVDYKGDKLLKKGTILLIR